MKYLVFDTETTGLPLSYNASAEDVENWPRVIQLAYAVFDDDTPDYESLGIAKMIESRVDLIKPDGWVMPEDKFWIDNGFSHEKSLAEGISIKEAMENFVAVRSSVDFSIAHNISFDGKILRAEMIRLGITTEFTSKKICTMQSSTKFCELPNANGRGGYKWPKLNELHLKLFGTDFEGAHDAMNDVLACARCFFEMLQRGIILL
jgi:DNA polymerase III epsilon subunit-like protein